MGIDELLTMLEAAPARLTELAEGLSAAQLLAPPAPGEWSARDVLAHLRVCADMWGKYVGDGISIAPHLPPGQANMSDVAEGLAGLAAVASVQGHAEVAAQLFGAVQAVRVAMKIVLWPAERYEWDRRVAATQAQLDKATWARAWAEGQSMTLEEAVAYALESLPEVEQGTDE